MQKLRALLLETLEKSSFRKSPEAEADLILFHVFRREYPEIRNFSDLKNISSPASAPMVVDALQLARERARGIPLQHLLGEQYFYEHDYQVNDSTLIPRPETEILVQELIRFLSKNYGEKPFRFAELGIGSGIIATEILAFFKNSSGIASEVNPMAIALAHQNMKTILGADYENRISILEPAGTEVGFEVFRNKGLFDVIFSNPPYVSVNDEIEDEVLNHEPHLALYPALEGESENPNHFYESFLVHHSKILKPGGTAFFEVPHERAQYLLDAFKNSGFPSSILIPDLTGRDRVLQAVF